MPKDPAIMDDRIMALHIWRDIEKTYTERLYIHYEGNSIVGVDGLDDNDAIDAIQTLISRLGRYQSKLEECYGLKKIKKVDGKIGIKLSYIYLMLNELDGFYKIGRSLNPEYREKTLQSQAPQIIKIFTSPLTYQANETKLHNIFRDKRVRGEWFKLDESDILFIKEYSYGIA